MGLSASQARFLQLTARRSNVEYQAQQINFQRLQLSQQGHEASLKYEEAMSNKKMIFSYNTGSEVKSVTLSYANYKNYMNQQIEGLVTSQEKYYLVSSTGNKLVVGSEEERDEIIAQNKKSYPKEQILAAQEKYQAGKNSGRLTDLTEFELKLATMDWSNAIAETVVDEEGNETTNWIYSQFSEKDFLIAEDLNDVDNFQSAIQNGIYYFAKLEPDSTTGEDVFKIQGWDTLGSGAITEEYDKTDDAQAEAEYQTIQDRLQNLDKKLELKLDQLETERSSIQTEIDSITKVIDDNIESSFGAFS